MKNKLESNRFFTVGISIRKSAHFVCAYYKRVYPYQMVLHGWYFDYLAALLKVKYPKCEVNISKVDSCYYESKEDYMKKEIPNKIKNCQTQIKKLNSIKQKTIKDLFGFNHSEIDEKIAERENELKLLQEGKYYYWLPAEEQNNVKYLLETQKDISDISIEFTRKGMNEVRMFNKIRAGKIEEIPNFSQVLNEKK